MLQKKKGFTLIEVLVVMLVATLVFAMVGGTMVFITTTTDGLIQQAEEIDMAKNIEKYLRTINVNTLKFDQDKFCTDFRIDNNNLMQENNVLFADTNLETFRIEQDNEFIRCYMKFHSQREFNFILAPLQDTEQQQEGNQ